MSTTHTEPLKGGRNTGPAEVAAAVIVLLVVALMPAPPAYAQQHTPVVTGDRERSEARIVAAVGSRAIDEDELDQYIGREAFLLKMKLFTLRSRAIDSLIQALLVREEAKAANQNEIEYLSRSAGSTPKVAPTDVEQRLLADYDALQPLGETLGRYRVLAELEDRIKVERLKQHLDGLRAKADVRVFLVSPQYKLQVRASSCVVGNSAAPAKLVVFMDYKCPFCRKLHTALKQLTDDPVIAAKTQIAIKHMPLPQHEGAFRKHAENTGDRREVIPSFIPS